MKSSLENGRKFLGKQTISQGALTIALFTIISGILGLLRDRFLASRFLVTKAGDLHQSLDVYYAAFYIPDTVYYLIFLGALAAAFIPVFSSYISKKEEKEAFYLANNFLNLALIALFIVSTIIFIFAPYLIKIIAPGFEPEKQRLTVSLVRIMLFSPLFFGISNTAGAILNSYKRFTLFSLAPCFYNLGIIIMTVLFSRKWGIYAPAAGVLVGAFSHMLIQVVGAYHLGFRWRPIADIKHLAVRKVFKLMLPRAAALGVERINRWVYVVIASTLATGSVSIINLSENLQNFPVSFFSIPLATAVFPFLAEAASLQKHEDFNRNLGKGIRLILYLMIPVSILVFLLRVQIVRIILGAGHFGWTDTKLTGAALGIFAISLAAQGVIPLLARSFYALQDTATPFKLAIWTIATNVLGSWIFTHSSLVEPILKILKVKNGFDGRIVGLPLAFSISSFMYAYFLYIKLKKKTNLVDHEFRPTIIKIIFASLIMGILVQLVKHYFGTWVDLDKTIFVLLQFIISAVLGVLVYFALTSYLKMSEAHRFWGYLIRKKNIR